MAFCGALFAVGKGAALLNPVTLVCGATVVLTVMVCKKLADSNEPRITLRSRQEDGDMTSSEVETYLNLGSVGPYKDILNNKRPFSKGKDGDKGYVEADHIPPLDSLRRAEREPGFSRLRETNRALYDMVISLRNDPRGRNLLTVQVSRHHHREALSTGNSRASNAARGVLARRIARGEVKVMLKQAMIIAHPYVHRQMREDAGICRRPQIRRILLSPDRTMDIYRKAFLEVVQYFYNKGIINELEKLELEEFVNNLGFFDTDSSEYQEIFEIVKKF